MREVISQGVFMPLNVLKNIKNMDISTIYKGMDVTEVIGITKYISVDKENQYCMLSKLLIVVKKYHNIYQKLKSRLQFFPKKYFRESNDKNIVVTRKEDGCSVTYYNGDFKICIRKLVWKKKIKIIYDIMIF